MSLLVKDQNPRKSYRVSQQVLDEEAVTENFKNTQNLNFGFVVKKFVKLKRDLHYLARM